MTSFSKLQGWIAARLVETGIKLLPHGHHIVLQKVKGPTFDTSDMEEAYRQGKRDAEVIFTKDAV